MSLTPEFVNIQNVLFSAYLYFEFTFNVEKANGFSFNLVKT